MAAWPVPVQDLVLIGHSMGGLVARSALHHAAGGTNGAAHGRRWSATPSLWGPPPRGAARARDPRPSPRPCPVAETRPLAKLLTLRSVGIKDLRRGTLVGADWADRDLDAREPAAHTHVPLHDGGRHFVVLAGAGQRPEHPSRDLLGDLLVTPRSAIGDTGDEQRLAFHPTTCTGWDGCHHFDLLNHPKVYQQIRTWLENRPEVDASGKPEDALGIAASGTRF